MYHERVEQLALLSPKPFANYGVEEFYEYIVRLRNTEFKKKASTAKPYKIVSISKNKKGTYVIRCRRQPKAVTRKEVDDLSKEIGESYLTTWNLFVKRKIKVEEIIEDAEIKIKELPF